MAIILRRRGPLSARVSFITSMFVALILATTSRPANADNGALYVAPGPTNLISADTIKRNQEQSEGTARKLGDLIGSSMKSSSSHASEVVVTIQCGHYKSATITFADGLIKTLNLSNAPASQKDMEKAKAAIPMLRIVDIAGCDEK